MAVSAMSDQSDHLPTRSPRLLQRQQSCLLIVDVQEKLWPVITNRHEIRDSIVFLLDIASVLNVPVFVSEQYPRGLGATVSEIADHPMEKIVFEKLRFSAANEFAGHPDFHSLDRPIRQVVLAGIETHICILQTALDLLTRGYQVFVVEDATGSRHMSDRWPALTRIREAGGTSCTAESVAFEWCEAAGNDEFRQISRLVQRKDAKSR